MFARLISYVRNRWHPLWRLRQLALFRRFQRRWDFTIDTRIPGTEIKVAVKLLRDASWIFGSGNIEAEIRTAFARVLGQFNPETFWDIGANIGFYSWMVRRHPSVRHVMIFEPDPTNFALITRTIRKNGITDCRPLNLALSDQAGEASFLVDRASGAAGSLEAISQRENEYSLHHAYQLSETITCRTVTIDGLIAEGAPPPQLIKIDVEGAEHLILAGAQACLARHRPAMIIETFNTTLIRQLLEAGYAVFRLDEGNLLFIAADAKSDLTTFSQIFPKYSPAEDPSHSPDGSAKFNP